MVESKLFRGKVLNQLQINRKHIFPIVGLLLLLIIVFRSILLNFHETLVDRFDYPYIAWVLHQNINHLLQGNFTGYFHTTGFYPHPYGMLFSDLLIPQSLIALPFFLLSDNILFSFNSVFIITFVLNLLSMYALWFLISRHIWVAFIGAILFVFGPFFHTQLGHFQMQTYWLGVLAFTSMFYLQPFTNMKFGREILAGVLIGLQFLASVYICVFFLAAITVKTLVNFLFEKKERKRVAQSFVVFLVVAFAIMLPFLKGYYDMKAYYHLERNMPEYILYSAHPTDYLFTNGYRSELYSLPVFTLWNGFNKHVIGELAIFPGITLSLLAILGLVSLIKAKDYAVLGLNLTKESISFFLIGTMGLFFSFGPRFSFNGTYAHIPNVYLIAQKILPLLESIRSTGRWSFLLYLAMVYFAVRAFMRVHVLMKRGFIITLVAFIIIEYIPLRIPAEKIVIDEKRYFPLVQECKDGPQVLLEFPVTHLMAYGGIVEGLSYISRMLLEHTMHECYLVNGYSGFIPPALEETSETMNGIVESGSATELYEYVKDSDVSLLKINQEYVIPELRPGLKKIWPELDSDPTHWEKIGDGIYKVL